MIDRTAPSGSIEPYERRPFLIQLYGNVLAILSKVFWYFSVSVDLLCLFAVRAFATAAWIVFGLAWVMVVVVWAAQFAVVRFPSGPKGILKSWRTSYRPGGIGYHVGHLLRWIWLIERWAYDWWTAAARRAVKPGWVLLKKLWRVFSHWFVRSRPFDLWLAPIPLRLRRRTHLRDPEIGTSADPFAAKPEWNAGAFFLVPSDLAWYNLLYALVFTVAILITVPGSQVGNGFLILVLCLVFIFHVVTPCIFYVSCRRPVLLNCQDACPDPLKSLYHGNVARRYFSNGLKGFLGRYIMAAWCFIAPVSRRKAAIDWYGRDSRQSVFTRAAMNEFFLRTTPAKAVFGLAAFNTRLILWYFGVLLWSLSFIVAFTALGYFFGSSADCDPCKSAAGTVAALISLAGRAGVSTSPQESPSLLTALWNCLPDIDWTMPMHTAFQEAVTVMLISWGVISLGVLVVESRRTYREHHESDVSSVLMQGNPWKRTLPVWMFRNISDLYTDEEALRREIVRIGLAVPVISVLGLFLSAI